MVTLELSFCDFNVLTDVMISDGCDLMTNVDEVMAVMLTKLM
jgi:hypothetical protein